MGERIDSSEELPDAGEIIPIISSVLRSHGCPPDKVDFMATQLDKRARQLCEQKGRSYQEALAHLLSIVKSGADQGS
jgi:hypothetical protein